MFASFQVLLLHFTIGETLTKRVKNVHYISHWVETLRNSCHLFLIYFLKYLVLHLCSVKKATPVGSRLCHFHACICLARFLYIFRYAATFYHISSSSHCLFNVFVHTHMYSLQFKSPQNKRGERRMCDSCIHTNTHMDVSSHVRVYVILCSHWSYSFIASIQYGNEFGADTIYLRCSNCEIERDRIKSHNNFTFTSI